MMCYGLCRHQIRCHLASIGLPIANDTIYGGTRQTELNQCTHQAFLDDNSETLRQTLGPGSASFVSYPPSLSHVVVYASYTSTFSLTQTII